MEMTSVSNRNLPRTPHIQVWRVRLLIATVVFFVLYMLWRTLVPPSLAAVAINADNAYISGDAQALYALSYTHEKHLVGLTPRKIEEVFVALVRPRLAGFHRVGKQESTSSADGSQGEASQRLMDAQGNSIDIDATPWVTMDGPKVNVLYNLLCNAWRAEYIVKRGLPVNSKTVLQSDLEGIRHDKAYLKSIGLEGFAPDNLTDPLVTWDYFEKRLQVRIDQLASQTGGPLPGPSNANRE